jgi:phenylpropionate dioxygenase-like ring-hydroxylating dioxygenase large terminal subunit
MNTIKRSPEIRGILDRISRLHYTPDDAQGLPKECYTSSEFFEFEKAAVFSKRWICVGRVEDIPNVGDHIAAELAGEPVLVVRQKDGDIAAMSAVCQHRGQVVCQTTGKGVSTFRCPLHFWSYDLRGRLVGAAHMGDHEATDCLKNSVRLPAVRCENWRGFMFVNLDPEADALGPTLANLEPFFEGYDQADLQPVPPTLSDTALPWNWKIHVENFTDAYHPSFVHKGTHDIAPSVHPSGNVQFIERHAGDNAIIRSVSLLVKDAGMNAEGWSESPAFPAIATLSDAQRNRLTFALLPPSMTLVFAPGAIAYTLLKVSDVLQTYASNDRVTAGGWLLPKSTIDLPDFQDRARTVSAGGSKIWAQDIPVNLAMQRGKASRYQPENRYGPLEKTLVQFNAWLIEAYRQAMPLSI